MLWWDWGLALALALAETAAGSGKQKPILTRTAQCPSGRLIDEFYQLLDKEAVTDDSYSALRQKPEDVLNVHVYQGHSLAREPFA